MTSPAVDETNPFDANTTDDGSGDYGHNDSYPDPSPAEQQAILALTALLAAGVNGQKLNDRATALLGPLGLPAAAILAAVRLATASPAHGVPRSAALRSALAAQRTALNGAISGEPAMRARYLLAAAQRLASSLLPGDGTARERFTAALDAERRYGQQHADAQTRRLTAAAGVDGAAGTYGDVLGWYTVIDGRTTPDCIALDGTNFSASQEPAGGWPGARHGGTCRCSAGPAYGEGYGDSSAQLDTQAAA